MYAIGKQDVHATWPAKVRVLNGALPRHNNTLRMSCIICRRQGSAQHMNKNAAMQTQCTATSDLHLHIQSDQSLQMVGECSATTQSCRPVRTHDVPVAGMHYRCMPPPDISHVRTAVGAFMYQIPNRKSPSTSHLLLSPTCLGGPGLGHQAGTSAPALKSRRRRPPGPAQKPWQAPEHW